MHVWMYVCVYMCVRVRVCLSVCLSMYLCIYARMHKRGKQFYEEVPTREKTRFTLIHILSSIFWLEHSTSAKQNRYRQNIRVAHHRSIPDKLTLRAFSSQRLLHCELHSSWLLADAHALEFTRAAGVIDRQTEWAQRVHAFNSSQQGLPDDLLTDFNPMSRYSSKVAVVQRFKAVSCAAS